MSGGVPRGMRLAMVLAVVPVLAVCGRDDTVDVATTDISTPSAAEMAAQPLRVSEVNLGRSIGADRRVTNETDDFRPSDTVYASVATEGTGSGATLTARWRFQDGQIVDETSQPISPTGPAFTEFHISMPTGLPVGNYTVEIVLNGQTVETESFKVEAP